MADKVLFCYLFIYFGAFFTEKQIFKMWSVPPNNGAHSGNKRQGEATFLDPTKAAPHGTTSVSYVNMLHEIYKISQTTFTILGLYLFIKNWIIG